MNSWLLYLILIVVFSIFAPDNRYRSAFPRRRYNRFYQMFMDDEDYSESVLRNNNRLTLANRLRAFFRRRKALKFAKKYLTKNKYIYTLKNENIIVIYDKKNKTLSCLSNVKKSRSINVSWAEQYDSNYNNPDNIFEQTFDNICFAFNKSASYQGIVRLFKKTFDVVQESEPEKKVVKAPFPEPKIDYNSDEPIKFTPQSENMLDVNMATEEQLAKLPGINIVLAKRIVQSRNLRGGYRSVPEIYNEFKIKPHFQRQLDRLICVNENSAPIIEDDFANERIVDL